MQCKWTVDRRDDHLPKHASVCNLLSVGYPIFATSSKYTCRASSRVKVVVPVLRPALWSKCKSAWLSRVMCRIWNEYTGSSENLRDPFGSVYFAGLKLPCAIAADVSSINFSSFVLQSFGIDLKFLDNLSVDLWRMAVRTATSKLEDSFFESDCFRKDLFSNRAVSLLSTFNLTHLLLLHFDERMRWIQILVASLL